MRLTESGSDQAKAGVSMADQLKAMMADMLAASMAEMKASLIQTGTAAIPVSAPAAVQTRAAKLTSKAKKQNGKHTAATAPESTGKWYLDALNRIDKSTGKPYYSVDFESVMVHGDIAIMRSHKWAPVLMLIRGRRKPVYLKAIALGALLEANGTLNAFVKTNSEYLADSIGDGSEEE
jgi:hypothetical protein